MRILFVTPLYLPWLGGLEVLAGQLVAELRRRGHEVAVVTGSVGGSLPFGVVDVEGVTVLRTDVYRTFTGDDPLAALHLRRTLRAFVDGFDPDVVHSHDLGMLAMLCLRSSARRRPLLATLHNVMTLLAPEQVVPLTRCLRLADHVTGVSADVVADALVWDPSLRGRVSVVRNGVAPPGPAPGTVADGPAELLAVGRLVPQKGFDTLLTGLALLLERRPDVRLTMAGVGPDRGELQAQARRLGIAAQVHLVGRVEHDRIAALFASSTVVVMPSRFEGLPLVALEAMWMARPVVGTDVPGLRHAVDHGVTGLLVAADDSRALAAALQRLVDDRDEARAMGAAGRAAVERDWSLASCVDAYTAIYERLAA